MAMDDHVKILLEKMAALREPKIWDIRPRAARAAMRSSVFRQRDEPIGKSEDRHIPGPVGEIGLRIYTPVNAAEGLLPGLVFFHGGGFVLGDLDTHDGLCRALCNESGCRVISVDYRLAPEHPFPAGVEDCFAATRWVADHAAALGIDAARLAVGGDSAGGTLATVVAQMAHQAGGPHLVFQLLIYPVAQLGSDQETVSMREKAKGYFLERESMAGSPAAMRPIRRIAAIRAFRRCCARICPACHPPMSSRRASIRCMTKAAIMPRRWTEQACR